MRRKNCEYAITILCATARARNLAGTLFGTAAPPQGSASFVAQRISPSLGYLGAKQRF